MSIRTGNRHICGGSIISHYHILTAAHCFRRYYLFRIKDQKSCKYVTLKWFFSRFRTYTVQIGSDQIYDPNATVHAVERVVIHPRYVPSGVDCDLGILKVRFAWMRTQNHYTVLNLFSGGRSNQFFRKSLSSSFAPTSWT